MLQLFPLLLHVYFSETEQTSEAEFSYIKKSKFASLALEATGADSNTDDLCPEVRKYRSQMLYSSSCFRGEY
jgi:hypothetical protein